MRPDELASIKARAEAAWPGPWTWQHTGSRHWLARGDVLDPELCVLDDGSAGGEYAAWIGPWHPNGVFVAAARDDVPALVAEVERLTADIQKAIAACETCGGQGIITLDYDGEPDEDNCPDCAPLRRLMR
jgi:hypothetical protein